MKIWYDRIKKDLIETSVKLRSSDISQEEREKLYKDQIDLIVELDNVFDKMSRLIDK